MRGVLRMRKILNKVISRIKGEKYELDSNIPTSYLISLIEPNICPKQAEVVHQQQLYKLYEKNEL